MKSLYCLLNFLIYDRLNFSLNIQQGLKARCNTDCVYRKLNVVQRKKLR